MLAFISRRWLQGQGSRVTLVPAPPPPSLSAPCTLERKLNPPLTDPTKAGSS
jgi:hypothetical protein